MRMAIRCGTCIILLLAAGCSSGIPGNRVDAKSLTLSTLYVQAVDAETGKEIRVEVGVSSLGLAQFLKTDGGEKAAPVLVETTDSGLCRATWIGTSDDTAAFTLTADGYEPVPVPSGLVERLTNTEFRSAIAQPKIVKLKRLANNRAEHGGRS